MDNDGVKRSKDEVQHSNEGLQFEKKVEESLAKICCFDEIDCFLLLVKYLPSFGISCEQYQNMTWKSKR